MSYGGGDGGEYNGFGCGIGNYDEGSVYRNKGAYGGEEPEYRNQGCGYGGGVREYNGYYEGANFGSSNCDSGGNQNYFGNYSNNSNRTTVIELWTHERGSF